LEPLAIDKNLSLDVSRPGVRTQKLGFIAQLDSFRFFAVFLVIVSHWLPDLFVNKVPNGYLGVTFFFVLSGYLISSNLLLAKKAVMDGRLAGGAALGNFYARRFLRIFPLYYFTLFLIWALNKNIYEHNFLWYILYGSNILFYVQRHWQESLSHFWSLAVEEQFYLVWPMLMLMVPSRLLKPCLIIVVASSICYKLLTMVVFPTPFGDILTFAALDSFGLGALLAYMQIFKKNFRLLDFANIRWAFILIIVAFVLAIIGQRLLLYFTWPYFSTLLIAKAYTGYRGFVGYLLNNRILRYFGKISYGIYVYHNFIPWFFRCLRGTETQYPISLVPLLKDWHPSTIILLVTQFCFLIGVTSISWFCLEKPINELKRYF